MNNPVSFELAKLLKEKGFVKFSIYKDSYPAPTIAEVVCWFYEKHNIWIQANISRYGTFYCNILKREYTKSLNNPISWEMQAQLNDYSSPKEAYEAGIKYVLEKMITDNSK